MTAEQEIVVRHEVGLHARPAAKFVKLASGFTADIEIENLSKGSDPANAKSIISVLSVSVTQDEKIRLTATGEDEEDALEALISLIENNFDGEV